MSVTEQKIQLDQSLPSVANLATRKHWADSYRLKARAQDDLRRHLDRHARRPKLPCSVTIVRCAHNELDAEDNLPGASKYLRDTVARWAHGLEEQVVATDAQGRPKLTRGGGRVKMTRPHAPDGPDGGIVWLYEQQQSATPMVIIIIREFDVSLTVDEVRAVSKLAEVCKVWPQKLTLHQAFRPVSLTDPVHTYEELLIVRKGDQEVTEISRGQAKRDRALQLIDGDEPIPEQT